MKTEEIESKYQLMEDGLLFASNAEKSRARREFVKLLENELLVFPESADLWHKIAVCLYGIPEWTDAELAKIETSLLKAIEIDPDSIFSRIYLTYFYYDRCRFKDSLSANPFEVCVRSSTLPLWRTWEMLELTLCCRLQLKEMGTDELLEGLTKLKALVERDYRETSDDLAFPQRLSNLLSRQAITLIFQKGKLSWTKIVNQR